MKKARAYYKTKPLIIDGYGYEDEIRELSEKEFEAIYRCSIVNYVRLYPIVEIDGKEYYLGLIPCEEE